MNRFQITSVLTGRALGEFVLDENLVAKAEGDIYAYPTGGFVAETVPGLESLGAVIVTALQID